MCKTHVCYQTLDNIFVFVQMTTRVDGHSWALSAIDEFKVQKIVTPLNKDIIPITDSPVVVQQHMLPPKKFVLLSAQVSITFLHISYQNN